MKRNVLAVYKRGNEYFGGVWPSWEAYHRDLFSPACEEVFAYDFTTQGKTHQERKAFVRDFAVAWSNTVGLTNWSYGEMLFIGSEFRRLGGQYGLLTEFAENAVC